MELYQAQDNFIILNGPDSLWCNRLDGRLQPRFGVDLGEAWSLKCRGIVYGIIGKIQFFPGADWRLLVISKRTLLGSLPGGHEVYRIDRVAVLTLSSNESPEFELEPCELHQSGGRARKMLGVGGGGLGGIDNQQRVLGQTWSKIKIAATTLKEKNIKDRDLKDKEKLERRFVEVGYDIAETIYRVAEDVNDSDSFFYSPSGDLTNTLQRQFSGKYNTADPLWTRCDKRFFWNEFMVKELLISEDPLAHKWITPIIQGYCKIAHCVNTFEDDDAEEGEERNTPPFPPEEFELVLISRRSVYRAGTRYRRRGVDDNGDVANYVETEQFVYDNHIICTKTHNVSFAQVRGSVPVYWSQPGYKYRPPPRLDRDEKETLLTFRKHFDHQLELYKTVAVINLVDQTGREKIISDVFMDNILAYNSPFLTYITFDFHEYCRGMKFENVSVLVESILDVVKDVRYCWTDDKGIICDQRGVFRVNCMDCLDRTNVVQAALARHIMEQQLKKLGKQLPDQLLPASIRTSFQEMWASNGDAISRQYAGTAAMKGDFTRTGERKFTGVMKDGYNSANRYYLNRFKAAYRQTLIDVMLGNPVTEDIAALIAAMKNGRPEEEQWTMEREECVAQLVQHCKQLLLTDEEECMCGWALVDPLYSTDGEVTQDQDVILLLTYHAYYVASYDDEAERITQYERIALEDVEKIEIGFETSFKSKYLFIRLYRRHQGNSGYFHTLRTIQHRTAEDARSVLLCIADAFASARATLELGLKVAECRLDRKKTKTAPSVIQISSKSRLSSWSKPNFQLRSKSAIGHSSRDLSFSSLHRSKLGALPTSFSDSCLAKRRLDDTDEFKNPSASAPQSFSGSSSSSGSEDEDDTSGETEDMDHYDPLVTNAVSATGGEVKNEATESKVELLPEDKTASDETEGENGESSSTQEKLQTEDFSEEGGSSKESRFLVGDDTGGEGEMREVEEGEMGEGEERNNEREANVDEEGNVSRKTTDSDSNKLGPRSQGSEWVDEKTNESQEMGTEELIGNDDEGSQSEHGDIRKVKQQGEITDDQLTQEKAEGNVTEDEGNSSSENITTQEEGEGSQNEQGEITDNQLTQEKAEGNGTEDDDNHSSEYITTQEEGEGSQNEQVEITDDQLTQEKAEGTVTEEDDNHSSEHITSQEEGEGSQNGQGEITDDQLTQEKAEVSEDDDNASSEHITTPEEPKSQLKQENGEIKSKELDSEANTNEPQISFHGATASLRVSHSSVELGRMASSGIERNGEGSPERRRIGSRFLNRSTGNGSPKLNIFATAQARGRTLLPELRSKLSSFSQQVRSRSPRLSPKRPSFHSESNTQQKQLRRKCRSKIIEL
ncbi:Phosphatidylinositide phosphatase SAC2 [Desmophyllum pertusum]|uniref:Phosphatidylinositide phosphatase SAC2 n=1 Tax=Desmophyllum pertusum TaxID=174260 RepID=A0A9W9ZPT0_9CNID|nr:Phosphatidylinositide phosphatase SAC2 [Desmophyllum pertusum]